MKSYYFNSKNRSPIQDGSCDERAFSSLLELRKLSLEPSDKILLKTDSVFNKQFIHLKNVDDITITSYGEGAKPIINAFGKCGFWYQDYGNPLDSPTHVYHGAVSSTINIIDCNNISISNLEICNGYSREVNKKNYSDLNKLERTGVSVVAKDRGEMSGIKLEDLFIHDVYGNVYDKHMNNGGIYISALRPERTRKVARFRSIHINRVTVVNVSRWGIAVGYTYAHKYFKGAELSSQVMDEYAHHDIFIENSLVANAGGDGITVFYSDKPIVRNNEAHFCASEINDLVYKSNERKGKVAAGIWPWKCKDALFTNNLVTSTCLNQDGVAYDADSGDGTVYENNFSWANSGGAIMFCLEEAINSSYKNNISFDDRGGIFSPCSCPNGELSNNKIYKQEKVPFIRDKMGGGNYVEFDNTIITIKKGEVPKEIVKS